MKNLAILFLIATVLPSVWTRSLQEADDTLGEREDDLDITKLSEDELRQFVDEARESLKRAAEELFDDEAVQSHTPDKRQSPKINLGGGFGIGKKGLTFQRGRFEANVKPRISVGEFGFKIKGWDFGFSYTFR